jgi:hypothetical protein
MTVKSDLKDMGIPAEHHGEIQDYIERKFVAKENHARIEARLENLQTEYDSLKPVAEKVSQLETELKSATVAMTRIKKEYYALEKAERAGARNPKTVVKLMDLDEAEMSDDGTFPYIDEAIEDLKQTDDFLFFPKALKEAQKQASETSSGDDNMKVVPEKSVARTEKPKIKISGIKPAETPAQAEPATKLGFSSKAEALQALMLSDAELESRFGSSR